MERKKTIVPQPPSPEFIFSQMSQRRTIERDADYESYKMNPNDEKNDDAVDDFGISLKFQNLEATIYEDEYVSEQPKEIEKVKKRLFDDEMDEIIATPISRRTPERLLSCRSTYCLKQCDFCLNV